MFKVSCHNFSTWFHLVAITTFISAGFDKKNKDLNNTLQSHDQYLETDPVVDSEFTMIILDGCLLNLKTYLEVDYYYFWVSYEKKKRGDAV